MEIPKRTITFIDTQDKKYVLPVKLIAKHKLEPFLQHAPPREKDSTSDDAIFKFPDHPDTIEVMVQVLQHGEFNQYPRWEEKSIELSKFLSVVRVGEKYHVHNMAHCAAGHFEDHVSSLVDYFPDTEYSDFAEVVRRLYAPVLPEGWDTMSRAQLLLSVPAPSEDSYIPLLKRHVVDYAAKNYESLLDDDDCADFFDPFIFMYNGPHPFHRDVKKAMKKQQACAKKGGEMCEHEWSDFFTNERYVTIFDRNKKKYLLSRTDVLEKSSFLYEHAPVPSQYSFVNETYKLPDHPHGVRAIAAMIEDGPRYFDVPDDVQEKGLAVQYFAHALAAGDKYGILNMREAVEGLLRCYDYLTNCKKPSTIVHAVKIVYALKPYGKKDKLLRELKDQFVEWAVERGEGWDENVFRRVCETVPAFKKDVRKAEEEKKRRAAEEGGKKDKDVDGGAAADGQREE